jgi:AcrR family transcriptional regulator
MSDIAAAVNVQKASLYHHVSSKQEILLDLLERALQILSARISEIAAQNISPEEKLRRMIKVYLQLLAENTDLSSVLLFEHRSLDKKARTSHIPRRDQFEALWRGVLDEGAKNKTFNLKDTGLAVRAIMGALNWTLTWYHPDGPKSIEQIADEYSDFILKGMLK